MGDPRDFVLRFADELGERASVAFGSGATGEAWARFTPRNSDAAPITVHYSTTDPEAEPWLDIADFLMSPGDLDDLAKLVRAVAARGARITEGRGRTRLEVFDGDGPVYAGTAYDIRVLVPAFLWRSRPCVRCYEPYG
jgi:hypothetical protein